MRLKAAMCFLYIGHVLTGLIFDIGVNMGKKANMTDNIQQKLSLAVKSGKFKVGKYSFHNI